ncbi:MAG: hypothetical protein DUD32_09285 [Lactobacillus sp.]|jgi:hypothetical protein|nr:MAG: hypothetical protein DUD32_09285 [Lactobacillus sp.]
MKQTDYGLVSCQFERDMIARADKAIKQDKRRAKQHGAFNMHKKVHKKGGVPTQTPSTLH